MIVRWSLKEDLIRAIMSCQEAVVLPAGHVALLAVIISNEGRKPSWDLSYSGRLSLAQVAYEDSLQCRHHPFPLNSCRSTIHPRPIESVGWGRFILPNDFTALLATVSSGRTPELTSNLREYYLII